MDSFVKRQMVQQNFTVYSITGTSDDGSKTYSAGTVIKGYHTDGLVLYRPTLRNDSKPAETQIYIDGLDVASIKEGDLIKPVDRSTSFLVIRVLPYYKEKGILDYGVVFIQ